MRENVKHWLDLSSPSSSLPMKRKPSRRRMCRKLGDLHISAPYQVIKLPAGVQTNRPVSEYRLIYIGVYLSGRTARARIAILVV